MLKSLTSLFGLGVDGETVDQRKDRELKELIIRKSDCEDEALEANNKATFGGCRIQRRIVYCLSRGQHPKLDAWSVQSFGRRQSSEVV